MTHQPAPPARLAFVPLVGNQDTDEAYLLGALLSRLLGAHLAAAGVPILDDNLLGRHLASSRLPLPLTEESLAALRDHFKLHGLIHGQYTLDGQGQMFGLRLLIAAPDVPAAPFHISAPLSGFAPLIERVSLALLERLGVTVTDPLRQRVRAVARPAHFEAFRQLAQAHAAWNRGQNELALAAVTSALALDPDYEDAVTIEVAIARAAGDTLAARDAFRRWSALAIKRGRARQGAERLMLLGHWLSQRGEWEEALHAYEGARDVLQRQGDEPGVNRALNNIANLELLAGKTQTALKTYRRSLRVFEAASETQRDATITYLNIALAHKILGQREEALLAAEQALSGARLLKDTALEAHCLAQRGAIYQDQGDWAQASDDYGRAISLLDIAGEEAGLAVVKSHQASLLREQGSYRQAEALLLEALSLCERHAPGSHDQALIWLNLAGLYYAMGLTDQAWTYAEQAHDALAHLKSGWEEQAGDLLEALEGISLPSTGLPAEPAATPAPASAGDRPGLTLPGLESKVEGEEALYNDDELYDNEDA